MNKAGQLVSEWIDRGRGLGEAHGKGRDWRKGLTVYWWQVFFGSPGQGINLVSKNLACQAWELGSQQTVWVCRNWVLVGRVFI